MNDIVKADNNAVQRTSDEIKLIHDTYAKNTTETEFKLFLYAADRYGLDPLLKQIWCVKFANQPAQIYAGRDGFLEVAHRSGQFNGIESGMKDDKTAYAKVYRKDMDNPFYVEVSMSEYATGQALWKSKPKTMLIKVAESQALRRAFSISGIYSPEEMGQWECEAQGIKFEKPKAVTHEYKDTSDGSIVEVTNPDLDPETYVIDFGKHKGKKMTEADGNYIQWLIDQSKKSTFKQTKDGFPMQDWIDFLTVCLKIHQEVKENPPTFANIDEATPQELEEEFEKKDEKLLEVDEFIDGLDEKFKPGKTQADKMLKEMGLKK